MKFLNKVFSSPVECRSDALLQILDGGLERPSTASSKDIAAVREERQLRVALHEHDSMLGDVSNRIVLQNRNLATTVVVVAALTGYIVDKWNDTSFDQVVDSELITLVAICPLLILAFLWRHLDHDANILDKASYVDEVIRPQVVSLTDNAEAMSFESHLREARGHETRRTGLFALFGDDQFIIFGMLFTYLVFGWYLRFLEAGRAGTADRVFDVLLYITTSMTVFTVHMAVNTRLRYSRLGSVNPKERRKIVGD